MVWFMSEEALNQHCILQSTLMRLYTLNKNLFCLNSISVAADVLFIVTPIVGVCYCSMFCCTLFSVHL